MRFSSVVAAAFLLVAPWSAHAGRVSSGLDAKMRGLDGSEPVKVLVVLQDQAPIRAIDEDLLASAAPMRERHSRVVVSLREAASRSQTPLLEELESAKRRGLVEGYAAYWLVNAVSVVATVDYVRDLAARTDVEVIEPDLEVDIIEHAVEEAGTRGGPRSIGMSPGITAIQADRVWEELGIDGSGALVGNMDTGVDGTHPALAARWRGNFAPAIECWRDAVGFGDETPVDRHSHGTHVMGTICGLAPGDTIGVAPGALWIADNSLHQGAGSQFDNDILTGLQWFADPDGDPFTSDEVPDVVQHSWGINESVAGYFDCDSRWWSAIDNCEAAGVVLVWAAGNDGPDAQSIRSPADRANGPYNTFSVGATETSAPYTIWSGSSRGPSGCGGVYSTKPEISAPGVLIPSAEPGGGYSVLTGTSMAGPHVAGVAALMRAANPNLAVQTVKLIIMGLATDLGPGGEDNTYGNGLVNAYDAVLAVISGYGEVEGFVTHAVTSDPIAGAIVDVVGDERQATTSSSGFFRLHLPPGDWTLEYRALDFISEQQVVSVRPDDVTDGSMGLSPEPKGLVSGAVTDDEGAPIFGATVTVLNLPDLETTSSFDGTYSIEVPDSAMCHLWAHTNGLAADVDSIYVEGNVLVDFVLEPLDSEDFESGDLIHWPWEQSGALPWTISTVTPFEGTYSARSGDINANQASHMALTLQFVDPGDVTFFYRVSSEQDEDQLQFRVDGVLLGSWSGNIPWTQATFPVSNGVHELRWTYVKNEFLDTGSDAAWVDLVDVPPVGAPIPPEVNVSPLAFNLVLQPGQHSQRKITISNGGPGDLSWAATLVNPNSVISEGSLLNSSGGPDLFGYRWIDSDNVSGVDFDWIDISGVGVPMVMSDNTVSGPHPLGFSFPFYGAEYTGVYVSSNGFLTFEPPASSFPINGAIPSGAIPNNLVAAYWDDMNPSTGGQMYRYHDAANNRFIVQWDEIPHEVVSGIGNPQTFEAILYADGAILIQYKDVSETIDCTVGIENAAGNDGLQVAYNQPYLHDNMTLRFSTIPWIEWLSIGLSSGSLPPSTAMDIPVLFEAEGLAPGFYDGLVRISTNDPDEPIIDVLANLTVSDATSVSDSSAPLTFALGDARPNPFRQSATIWYAIAREGAHVAIRVYDVGGRLVRTLMNGAAPAGRHMIEWDGSDSRGKRVATGVYFYRMDTPEFTDVRKMTLLK